MSLNYQSKNLINKNINNITQHQEYIGPLVVVIPINAVVTIKIFKSQLIRLLWTPYRLLKFVLNTKYHSLIS